MHGKIARYPPCGPYLAPGPEILTDLRGAFQTMWGKLGAQGWGRPRKLSASADSGFKVLYCVASQETSGSIPCYGTSVAEGACG